MEAYSSSAYVHRNNSQEANGSFHSSIHSVRKNPAKPWKKPIAPMPPTRPRVYKVDPVNFRDLVQKLTGAPDCSSQSQRLKSVAPPPLNVATHKFFGGDTADEPLQPIPSTTKTTPLSAFYKELMSEISSDAKTQKTSDCAIESNTFGLSLSPSSYNWSAYPLLSPGSLSTVL